MKTITTNTSKTGTTEKILTPIDKYFHSRKIRTDELTNTITAQQAHFNHRVNENKRLVPIRDNNLVIVNWNNQLWNVRILTELECFRLMGFTDKDFYKAQKVSSRRMLYYVAGNSIVVPVLETIFKKLLL